jgi:hypothetical protein
LQIEAARLNSSSFHKQNVISQRPCLPDVQPIKPQAAWELDFQKAVTFCDSHRLPVFFETDGKYGVAQSRALLSLASAFSLLAYLRISIKLVSVF